MRDNEHGQSRLADMRLRAQEWWHTLRLPGERSDIQTSDEQEQEAASTDQATAPGSALYQHSANRHPPRDVNHLHRREQQTAGFNTRFAVWLTEHVGSMTCAYIFAAIGIGSLVGVATNNVFLAAVFGSLSSYFLQLVLLPILSVGQNVLGRHQELQADEMFKTSQRSFHDIEEIMAHLSAQDDELLKQTSLLLRLCGEPAATPTPAMDTVPATPATPAARATPATRARRGRQPQP